MMSSRRALLVLIIAQVGMVALASATDDQAEVVPEDWRQHPALAEPDGRSGRGGKMVVANIRDPRVLAELSRRFLQTTALGFTADGKLTGVGDFERRQEYLLRLLDHYYFSDNTRLVGKTPAQVERIFGPGGDRLAAETQASASMSWPAGRDTFIVYFEKGIAKGAFYAMGY